MISLEERGTLKADDDELSVDLVRAKVSPTQFTSLSVSAARL